ncbi:MAG: large conductance mechanosensitive channel protein MscL [Acidimicrobiales bacterium]|nr:large conductance mechanosensitive channel protein MscL [Acidimicrobiales bacterium]
MGKLTKEFRDFVAGGNLIELAVAFIMGGLFAKIVESLVTNILMPIVGIVFGEPNFDSVMILTINDSQIRIGAFLTVVVSVLLTALGVFLFIVKPYNRFKKQPTPADVPPSTEDLLTEIRDILAGRR